MKKQNLLFFPFLFAMGIGLFSCNFGNSGNVGNYTEYLAVVTYNYNTGGILLGTPYFGYLSAPELNTTFYEGDCVLLNQFTIDYDDVSASPYYTASNITATKINQSTYVESDTVEIGDYTLPISGITGLSSCEFYQGKFFAKITCSDSNPDFRLVYKDNEDGPDGTKNFYLLAKASGTSTSGTVIIYAFDVSPLILMGQQDTTVQDIHYKFINANLKYFSGISDTGVPKFPQASQNSFIVPIIDNSY